ncbi:NrsF family protein [Sphingomonas sp. MMS24-J45]|uniref:NrsF family protein n=1 Tax=Sphingomonas sp. MMS24-J45 TaxID=3238806 RepID=UPI00384D0A7D
MTMASTDALIDSLAEQVVPVAPGAVGGRLVSALLIGSVVTALAVVIWLGLRPDLSHALYGSMIWIKWAYTLSIGMLAALGVAVIARPERRALGWLWLALLLPVGLLAALAVAQVMATPRDGWPMLWLGHSWQRCSISVVLLALPIFVATLRALRSLAPTRLRLAGAMAGLAAGGIAATLYGVHCPETAAPFVLTWYSLGIVAAMAIGAMIGPRALRW